MKITVEIDGDKLVEWFRERDEVSVMPIGDSWFIAASIRDILDGAIENMEVIFGDD